MAPVRASRPQITFTITNQACDVERSDLLSMPNGCCLPICRSNPHYRIVESIGAGGMEVVDRAHDEQLNRDADICGLDRTYIGGIERGERNVSLINIQRIAKALKISIPRLLKKRFNPS